MNHHVSGRPSPSADDRRRAKCILVVCCAAIVLLLPRITNAQWTSGRRLSPDGDSVRTSYTNARCVGASADTVHAVWQGKHGNNWYVYHCRSLDGGVSWGEASPISNNTGANVGYPALAITGADVFVVWHDERDGNNEIYFRHSSDAGSSWKEEMRLTDDTGRSWIPSIAVSGRTLHVAWSDMRHGNGEIYYRRSNDAGKHWGEEIRLTVNPAGSEAPCIEATESSVHVAWYESRYGNMEIKYRRSRDMGVTWDPELRLTDDPFASTGMSLAVGGSDVHVVWQDIRTGAWDIHHICSTDGGGNWGEDVPLTLTTTASWFPSVAVSGPDVHVVWADEREGTNRVMYKHSSDRGEKWSPDMPLSDSSASARYVSISHASPAMHVVWTDSRNGIRKILYSRNSTGSIVSEAGHGTTTQPSHVPGAKYKSHSSQAAGIRNIQPGTGPLAEGVSVRRTETLVDGMLETEAHTVAQAQRFPYQERLYYTCKVWGLVKYNHPRVASCSVDWDSVLLQTLPAIKSAATEDEFNNALMAMLAAAGTVPPAEDTMANIALELRRNRDFNWISDAALRRDVQVVLNTIVSNARPGRTCHVQRDPADRSYLLFPHDNPILDVDIRSRFPGEFHRLRAAFSYWNMLEVFNPNRHILDTPWDSTLRRHVLSMANARDYSAFYTAFRHFTAALNDAHVEGMTSSTKYQHESYAPKIVLVHTADGYAVSKSGVPDIVAGDLLLSVDGKSMQEWEDSLRSVISAGNDAVFRRTACNEILRGAYYSPIAFTYRDGSGVERSYSGVRNISQRTVWYYSVYPSDSLAEVKWKKWACEVGYVNLGNLSTGEVDTMISELQDASAIIFDVRNYPRGTVTAIADRIFPGRLPAVELMYPDTSFLGSFRRETQQFGVAGNTSPYTGRVIILCDEQTQSHAEWTCMILRAMPGAVIVGSTTAGADGNVTRIRFTRDIATGYTSVGVYWPGGENTQRTGIVPDSFVIRTATDIRRRRDPVLEKALEIAGCPAGKSRQDPKDDSSDIGLLKDTRNRPQPVRPVSGAPYRIEHQRSATPEGVRKPAAFNPSP